jgi:hypothetical protein
MGTYQLVTPQYGNNCFSDLPGFIGQMLGRGDSSPLLPEGFQAMPQRYRRVVVVLLDAFGWQLVERHQSHPFLDRFARHGSVTRLTSQFPSTTSAHITTLYSDLPVGQHGVFEWFYYEPLVDAMIAPLLFSYAGDEHRETLQATGIKPEDLFPHSSLVHRLANQGVASTIFLPKELVGSSYTSYLMRGGQVMPYITLPEALVNVAHLLRYGPAPLCIFLYFSAIDSLSHGYGPGSAQASAEAASMLSALERWLRLELPVDLDDTLLLVTADHGQIEVNPAQAIYLNHLAQFDSLEPLLRRNRGGRLLVPGGSCRDMFLYVDPERLEEAEHILGQALGERADVRRVSDLGARGLFGPPPVSDVFMARVGELVILPRNHETVWWYEKDRFEQRFKGHHGGLTQDEMEIPLLLWAF